MGRAKSRAFGLLCLAAAAWAGTAWWPSAAEAEDNTGKKVWHLELAEGRPTVTYIGREPDIERYWYLPFVLKNPDDRPHSFFIEVTAESDKGVTYRAQHQPNVLEKARRRLGLKPSEKLWSAPDLTTGHPDQKLPSGKGDFPVTLQLPEIGAKESVQCVAIFRGLDREMDFLKITVRGLSNDVQVKKTDNPHERLLIERVLVLRYKRPGDELYTQEDPIEFVERTWESKETRVKTDLD